MRRSSFCHRACFLLSTAGLCAFLVFVSPSAAQENDPASGYPVHGTVVDAVSGQPVGRALVVLGQQYAQLTDAGGQFAFDHVPVGGYGVEIRKPGYQGIGHIGGTVGFSAAARVLPAEPIQVGPDLKSLTLRLTPLSVIAGHVTLSTSDPADGIQVMAYTRQLQNGRYRWIVAGVARTRSDGSFRIDELGPGSYMVYTEPSLESDRVTNDGGPVWGYPAVYYPGAADPSGAGILSLKAGQQTDAEISLVRQQFFPVTAVVRSPNPDRFGGYQIFDSAGRPTRLIARYDRRDGVVHASVPNGRWSLQGQAYSQETGMLWGRTEFQISGAPVSFAISLLSMPRIPVDIQREFTSSSGNSQPPISGAGVSLSLISADDFAMSSYGGGMRSDNNQDWEIQLQQPGRYWVQAEPFPPAYISSITSGGVDLASTPLTIVPGSNPAPIDITLRNDGGTLSGQIESASASSGPGGFAGGQQPRAWIYAIPLFPVPGTLWSGMVGPNGQFSISNLAPGSYRVVACDSPQEIDFHSPEGLAAWAGKGQTVTVDPGGSAHVELSVISTEGDQ